MHLKPVTVSCLIETLDLIPALWRKHSSKGIWTADIKIRALLWARANSQHKSLIKSNG